MKRSIIARGVGRRRSVRWTLVLGVVVALATTAAVAQRSAAGEKTAATTTSCNLGNGVKHVISLVFDNVHFARDNPNVPSDLEQMPHLLNFLEQNGTVFSNVHTPLIAHTADDSLTIYTGLYGDRHGQPLTNSYKVYNPDGTTDPAASFAYWTSPIIDTKSNPPGASTVDSAPTMAYSDSVPAKPDTSGKITPAPWVPYTRAGCSVGDFSTANMVLENAAGDVPTAFGPTSPEAQQTANDPDPYKDTEIADYVGEAIHCAQGDAVCASSSRPVPDSLPTEPGGYSGYQALFGAKYVAPQLGAGTPNKTSHGYAVTNAAGNLVDLDGNQINGAFLSNHPGFPGFSPTASQSLAMVADMQEAGVPVTYGYISDLHERKAGTSGCTTSTATGTGYAIGPGDSCYVSNAKAYDEAFAKFFDRLQQDGITPQNTLFVISAEENDQFDGANVGRAAQPTPANCDGVTVPCSYANPTYQTSQIGEVQANVNGLLSGTASQGTTYYVEPQGASVYVKGQPAADDPAVRQLERDTASMTNPFDPYTGVSNEKIVDYQAGALEQRVLHMQTVDPLRTPTFTMFPKPDYYFSQSGPNIQVTPRYAWNHGYYTPNIDITWAGMVGPGVAAQGVDGPQPADGNEPHDPNSTNTVPQASKTGTWVEETDLRPTMLYLAGLKDDYQSDGHVITQALAHAPAGLQETAGLAATYDQLNSSVGEFATDTLIADTKALASGSSSSDARYRIEQAVLQRLADSRDALATDIKQLLSAVAFDHARPNHGQVVSKQVRAQILLRAADALAAVSSARG